MPHPLRIALTGAAGRVAYEIIPVLSDAGHTLVLADLAEIPAASRARAHDAKRLDLSDVPGHAKFFRDCDLVVHLGGAATEQDWDSILHRNMTGTRNILQATADAGVPAILLASSIHAAGMLTVAEVGTLPASTIAPDGYYGASKVTLEALGSLYADRFNLRVTSARICTFQREPEAGRGHATWLSPEDMCRLIDAAATAPTGHRVVWGVSANEADWFPLTAGHEIGYFPQDNAADYPDSTPAPGPNELIGGIVTADPYPVGVAW